MLTDIVQVQAIVGMSNQAAAPVAWLNTLIGAASQAIKTYLKRDIELTSYIEYHNGNTQRDIICRQFPVLAAQTQIAAGSDGLALPQATINVNSTAGFCGGTFGNPNAQPPTISIQTGINTYTTVTYTSTTPTSFLGCSGGSGTMSMQPNLNAVFTPVVWYDPQAQSGQAPNAFATGTQLVMGTQYMVVVDKGPNVSHRGLIRRIGGQGAAFVGFYSQDLFSGKLSAHRLPSWTRGDGNIKVAYSAGYNPVPFDIQYACSMLVAYMVRNMPSGGPLESETLGAYSYHILNLNQTDVPELGSIARTLAPYRESSWGTP